MKRQPYYLTAEEIKRFEQLRAIEDAAVWFWKGVAIDRGLDPGSLLHDMQLRPQRFTALPAGHGKAWCFPWPLKCAGDPAKVPS